MKHLFSLLIIMGFVQLAQAITLTTSVTNVTCNGSCNGSAKVTASGGRGTYKYHWSTGATTAAVKGLCAGKYRVTVTDGIRSSAAAAVTISQPPAIVINGVVNSVNCSGNCNGAINTTVTGGTPPYRYVWSMGATTQNIAGLCTGTYCVTVVDNHNCTRSVCFSVIQTTAPTLITQYTNVSCNGGCNGTARAIDTGGVAPYVYLWSNGATTASIVNLCPGTYCVTVTGANGCRASACITITQPDALNLTSSGTNSTCAGACNGSASATLTGGTPPYRYRWNIGATTQNLANLCPGNYCVTATDNNGCSSTACVAVSSPAVLVASASVTNTSCSGGCDGSALASVTGGVPPYIYHWSTGASQAAISGLCAGSYCVTVVDNHNCISSACFSVIQSTAPTLITQYTNVSCNGGCNGTARAIDTGGVKPYTYVWSNGATTANIVNLCPGAYCVTVTGANGCRVSACVTITQPDALILTPSGTNSTCGGACNGSASATLTGGTAPYRYRWNIGATTQNLANLCGGNYCVTATDNNGCSATACVAVTSPAVLVASASVTNASCSGCDGSAVASVNGGVPPYIYHWSTGASQAAVSGLCGGSYCFTVTDANGCFATYCVSVTSGGTCPVPTSLTARIARSGAVTLTWAVTNSCPVASYTVEVKRSTVKVWSSTVVANKTITLTGLAAGTTYQARVSSNCTGSSSAFSSIVTFTTAALRMEEGEQADNSPVFNVYPNPAQNELHLEMPYNQSGNNRTVKIINLLGQTVMEKVIPADITNDVLQLSGNLPNGNYIITLQDGNGIYNQRIIIAR